MIRFLTRLVPNKTVWKPLQTPFYKPIVRFSNANPIQPKAAEDLTKYSVAVNFFSLLTQYQIDKMKGNNIDEQTLLSVEKQIKDYAEDIFTSTQMESKITSNMLHKLKQENLLTDKMIQNLLTQLSSMTHETLHKFNFDFLITLLREIDRHNITVNPVEKEKLQSLILFQLGANKWEFVKDFLDLFAGKPIIQELFDLNIEEKLIFLLNSATLQVKNFQFFCSLAFSIYSTISNSHDRFGLIQRIEEIVEEKFNLQGATYDISDIENLLFFFPENMVFKLNTMSKLAQNILTLNSNISFESFKKFLKLAKVNNYVFSGLVKEHQEKVFDYITECSTVEDFRLFNPVLQQVGLYPQRIKNEESIMTTIRYFMPQLLKEEASFETDLHFVKFLLENTDSQEEKAAILHIIKTALNEVHAQQSLPYLCLLYAIAYRHREQGNLNLDKLLTLMIDILESKDSELNIPGIAEGVKYLIQGGYNAREMNETEQDLMVKIETLIKSEYFRAFLNFNDLKEFLVFLDNITTTKLASLATIKSLYQEFYPKLQEKIILEEIFLVLSYVNKMLVREDMIVSILNHGEKFIKETKMLLSLQYILEICQSMNVLSHSLKVNKKIQNAVKGLWTACEYSFFEAVIASKPTSSKKENIFLQEEKPSKDTKESKEDKTELNNFLTENELITTYGIFDHLIHWNIGSRRIYDTLQLVFTHYFENYKNIHLSDIAYYLGEINSPFEKFAEKLEAYLLETKTCGTPLDALKYAWFFAIRNNYNQELWNIITSDLGKFDTIDDLPVNYQLNMFEILFCVRVEKSYVDTSKMAKFVDKLDAVWEEHHVLRNSRFKEAIGVLFKEECYILEENTRAGLYKVDYMNGETNVVLLIDENDYLSDSRRRFGSVELKKRLLTKLGFKLFIIEKRKYLGEKKTMSKVEYVKKIMKGIPRDARKWKMVRNMKVPLNPNSEE